MLAAHVLSAFQIVCSCHSSWPQILELAIVRQCPGIAVGRSTALQRVRGACRRTFVLVAQFLFSQVPKFSFSTFGPTRLLPKLIRSRVDFLFAGFSHNVFSELEHDPPFRRVGDLPADVLDQFGDWPFGFKST